MTDRGVDSGVVPRMRRIASDLENISAHYDVIVVGSGYGGAIAASRLARAGRRVCVLERGKEILPGEFPDTQLEAIEQMQVDAPEGHVGSPTALFDFRVNTEQNALVGCGLGGTSLINANVALQPDASVFEDERWPAEVRAHKDTLLEEGFARALEMLRPAPYSEKVARLAKLEANRASAKAMGAPLSCPPINVNFETLPGGVNHVGVPQRPCDNCGDCVSGCNTGAKNTLLMNYLPDAKNHGAEIYCEVSVRRVERRAEGGWALHLSPLGQGREKFDGPELCVSADVVVLAAGTLGSTEILLRSKAAGLPLSNELGKHFSGNGDILGFCYDADRKVDGLGFGTHRAGQLDPVGPCITSLIDFRSDPDWQKRMVIEEGSVPGALAAFFAAGMAAANAAVGENTDTSLSNELGERARQLEGLVLGPYHGATQNTQTYLVMGHDDGAGQLALEGDRLRIVWPGVGEQTSFEVGNQRLRQATAALHGSFVENPIWTPLFQHSLITVHPLGGCVMGGSAAQGVVNHKGQVFSGAQGAAVYEDLYVTDGSVIPTSLAVNPLLTISAVSERCVALLAQERGWSIDYALPSRPRGADAPATLGVRFTECMSGSFSTEFTQGDAVSVYEAAERAGAASHSSLRFVLTIAADNLNQLIADPEHEARIVGTVQAPVLSPAPLTVTHGVFKLFVRYPETPDTRHMVYDMRLVAEDGQGYWFHGYKIVMDQPDPARLWHDTTTLYVTVYRGQDASGPVVGKGILHIALADFAKQMATLKVTNAPDEKTRLSAVARFGRYFAGVCWEAYGGVFAKPTVFNPEAPPRKRRPLRAAAPELHPFRTEDGVDLLLTRYAGGAKGPVMLVHGLGVSSEIFSTDTIPTNLVEYLYAHGYDVWLLDFRASIALPASRQPSNGDQVARHDYPAAVARIRDVTGAASVQAVVHCWGATTFFMSLLGGLEGIRSVVCSQIACNIEVPAATEVKTGLHVPGILHALGVESLTAYVDTTASWTERLYDKALDLYALSEAQGWCESPVCHRITFMYAPLYRHATLNDGLHQNLHELFGVANIESFEHLALLCRDKVLRSASGEDLYMPHLPRLRLPIRFIHGEQNQCYLPESTEKTYDLLRESFGEELYSRHVVPGYGHIDCVFGRDAVIDVYPKILEHLEQTAEGAPKEIAAE